MAESTDGLPAAVSSLYVQYGAYAHLFVDILLSFGMVLLLMDETVREVRAVMRLVR